jgi:hypothetical protein
MAQGGLLMQGDLLIEVPFLQPQADGTATTTRGLALLLTPTCDFALKSNHPTRHVVPIAPLEPDKPLPSGNMPLHLHRVPILAPQLADGGLVNFRGLTSVHHDALATCTRAATLDETGWRGLIAAYTHYRTRLPIDAASIELPVDDPRRIWAINQEALSATKLTDAREALQKSVETAATALLAHHGVHATNVNQAFVLLAEMRTRGMFPESTARVGEFCEEIYASLGKLYMTPVADYARVKPDIKRMLEQLDQVGAVLQEVDAPQYDRKKFKEFGIGNVTGS